MHAFSVAKLQNAVTLSKSGKQPSGSLQPGSLQPGCTVMQPQAVQGFILAPFMVPCTILATALRAHVNIENKTQGWQIPPTSIEPAREPLCYARPVHPLAGLALAAGHLQAGLPP